MITHEIGINLKKITNSDNLIHTFNTTQKRIEIVSIEFDWVLYGDLIDATV